ncbi:MAG TPA: hypothetical protein VN950_19150 [Terriglobales bacterium]|nr:hypothetical protein [Terriglobales bacterium]
MTKSMGPKTQRRQQTFPTVYDLLCKWNKQHQTLLVEIGVGIVTQAYRGILDEVASGNFLAHLKGSRSLLVLDGEWQRYAKIERWDGKHSVVVSRKRPNSAWMRLSDDPGERESELRAEPTEVDIQAALRQLTLWAQNHVQVIYRSGTEISDVSFPAWLVGPGDCDSFLVADNPVGRVSRIAGQILVRSANYVRVLREESHTTVFFRSENGNVCMVEDVSGSPEDQLMQLRSLSKLRN